jgi:hypothetical protein
VQKGKKVLEMEEELDRDFETEEDLLSFVEMRIKQINRQLDDLERVQASEQSEEFGAHRARILGNINRLQQVIKSNYAKFAGGEDKIENWEEIDMYASTTSLMERLSEIGDTNGVGV